MTYLYKTLKNLAILGFFCKVLKLGTVIGFQKQDLQQIAATRLIGTQQYRVPTSSVAVKSDRVDHVRFTKIYFLQTK